jgi:hypothetical protein
MKSICLFFAAMLAAISPAAASVTFGGPQFMTASTACEPFGCASVWPTEYQQVFLNSSMGSCAGGTCTITGMSFQVLGHDEPSAGDAGVVNGGTFTISLSTTSASVLDSRGAGTGLNTSNLAANLGSDNAVVYNGALPAISGGALTITFQTPFNYAAFRGNLLLDVQSTGPTNSGNPFMYLALGQTFPTNNSPAIFSRAWAGIGQGNYNSALGLLTTLFY